MTEEYKLFKPIKHIYSCLTLRLGSHLSIGGCGTSK